ncbi:MAG: hypothetical protein ACXV8K_10605 [Ilumatobacteraceae bacterium]
MDGRHPSVRIEHAFVLDRELIRRISESGMTFALVTNIDFFFAENDSCEANLIHDQLARTYPGARPLRTHRRGCMSSDCPATTWADSDNPFMLIQAAVTRKAYNRHDIVPGSGHHGATSRAAVHRASTQGRRHTQPSA